ncbi:MAG: pilus assembly protein [Alcanivorax sediminis]|uniref:pilus assembly protein n=1 Tax=Alcanivorax sediminis TaxID=2663008 RepID=UPI003C571B5C
MSAIRKLSYLVGLGVAIFLSVPVLHADDTEVYLQGIPLDSSNNIMLMIDTAGAGNSGDVIENIAAALNRVIDRTASSTNVGLSRYYEGGQPGGSYVAYPVRSLGGTAQTILTSLTMSGNGDAFQLKGSTISISDTEMQMVKDDDTRRYGFVFNSLAIPRHAYVTDAYIELSVPITVEGTQISLLINNVDEPNPFTTSSDLFAAGWEEVTIAKTTGPDNRLYNSTPEWDTRIEKSGTNTIRIPLTPVLQQMISRPEWCGNERIAFGITRSDSTFSFYTSESNGTVMADNVTAIKAPALHVEWDPKSTTDTSGLSGDDRLSCMGGEHRDVTVSENDAIELVSGGSVFNDRAVLVGNTANLSTVTTSTDATDPTGNQEAVSSGTYTAGLRLPDFGLAQGSVVSNAMLYLNATEVSGNGTLNVAIISGDAQPFDSDGSISSQSTLASTDLSLSDGNTGYKQVDVTALVNQLISSAGWTESSALGFILSSSSDSFSVRIGSVDDGISNTAYLMFDALATAPSTFWPNSRDALKQQVTLLASAKGGGKADTATSLQDMGSYMRGAKAITGGTYYEKNAGAEPADTFADEIFSSPYSTYKLPPSSAGQCSRSHIIMMAGKAPVDGSEAQTNISTATDGSILSSDGDCPTGANGVFTCSANFAKWLANSPDPSKRVPVATHVVGFQLSDADTAGYQKIAAAGDGIYVSADNVDEVESAFSEIIDKITVENASLAAPGVAVNQLNRFQHLDQLYYSVFKPEFTTQWKGNLKRYRLNFNSTGPSIVDAAGNEAVDPSTGFFKDGSRSWWSDSNDGNLAVAGGAKGEIDNGSTTRKLYYLAGSDSGLAPSGSITSTSFGTGTALTLMDATNEPTAAQMGLSDSADLTPALNFLKASWGDPLHSEPQLVTYSTSSEDNVIYLGTNDGMLHAINGQDGAERFSFIPPSELAKTAERVANKKLQPTDYPRSTYGLDGSWTTWRRVDGGNLKVYLFGGQRRGGRNLYAMDVTTPGGVSSVADPRLLWRIQGGQTPGFDDLGQTWSSPTLAQVKINGAAVPVLIFGGGYDPLKHDTAGTASSSDNYGNAIYMVNATNGKLIWSASDAGSNSGAADHTTVGDMKWSIPSDLSAVDLNLDGFIDAIYASDLGGQIFRVDLNMANTGVSSLVRRVEKIATLGFQENPTYATHRRFFASVAGALAVDSSGDYFIQLVIGSGYRAHPLELGATQDRIFMIEDKDIYNAQKAGYTSSGTVTSNDLVDITSNLSPAASDLSKRGWRIDLDKNDGEKVLGSAAILNGIIYMTTYVPVESGSRVDCSPIRGRSRLYAMNVIDGSPAVDSNNDSNLRYEDDVTLGLAPEPQILIGGEDLSDPDDDSTTDDELGLDDACASNSQVAVLVGTSVRSGGFLKGCGLKKTRWYQVDSDTDANAVIQAENPAATTP